MRISTWLNSQFKQMYLQKSLNPTLINFQLGNKVSEEWSGAVQESDLFMFLRSWQVARCKQVVRSREQPRTQDIRGCRIEAQPFARKSLTQSFSCKARHTGQVSSRSAGLQKMRSCLLLCRTMAWQSIFLRKQDSFSLHRVEKEEKIWVVPLMEKKNGKGINNAVWWSKSKCLQVK